MGDPVPVTAEQGGPGKGTKCLSPPTLGVLRIHLFRFMGRGGRSRACNPLLEKLLKQHRSLRSLPQGPVPVPAERAMPVLGASLAAPALQGDGGIKQGCCRLAGVTLGGLSGPARSGEQPGNLFSATGGVCCNPIAGEQKSPVLAGAWHWWPQELTGFSPSFAKGLGWEEELL